mgnify:CR=1 FL=1
MLESKIYEKVRLKPKYLTAIVAAFKDNFLPTDRLWIFGSRVNLQARGGDIDLYIETADSDAELVTQRRIKFIAAVWKQIGEQKIDVIIKLTGSKFELPIYAVAVKEGVQLV